MQPIVFADVRISYPEFQKINHRFALKQRWYRFLLLPLLVFAALWSVASGQDDPSTVPVLIGTGLAVSALALAYAVFNFNRSLKHQYQASPLLQATATYTLTDQGIQVDSPIWRGTTSWAAVLGYRKIDGWYYLAASAAAGFLLDPGCLRAPATVAEVDQLFRLHGLRSL
ncbi:hypothetical protein E5K00_09720 [Hymenobacter aquaticus]|uniref:YcxB family protein n=1 Tax=Hymenobacter aquaticus TaxID=1867101 RepID=A0A4Z0Q6Z3_9BACT|nr:hypothetical protein [Hymenobacter aquaticus]TGE25444.1 hypothetical protein E5K00_09720 [Hymenobacter aquaticus]